MSKSKSRHHAIAHALALLCGATLLSAGLSTPAQAQSNATSTIYGEVPPGPGQSIVLKNLATGIQRVLTPDANGKFQATSMPPGRYQIRLMRGDVLEKSLEVEALVGQGVEASFSQIERLDAVQVTGQIKRIDVSNTNNGVVLTAKELIALPLKQTVADIIQLAPGTNRYTNSQYGNAASFGGSGASENAFYINGFPVTNLLTQVGASELPFGAIANAQILSGGYGAEFGRATGGVVNITTKSGSNNWEVGGKLFFAPNSLRGTPDNSYYPNTGANPLTDGKLRYFNEKNSTDTKGYGLYAGGPLIKNKLFAFVALERQQTDSGSISATPDVPINPAGFTESRNTVDRGLLKLDFHLNDDHHFEFTRIHDETRGQSRSFGFNYNTMERDYVYKSGQSTVNCCGGGSAPGADISILKYTGYLTEDLTVTALYGESATKHTRLPDSYDPNIHHISSTAATRVPGLVYPLDPQTVGGTLPAADQGDSQKVFRLDFEYRLGKHSLRAGIDHIKVNSVVGETQAGGSAFNYGRLNDPNKKLTGFIESPAQGGGYGAQGYYVGENVFFNISRPSGTQSAQYIQDRYQISDNILLDLGLRNESFNNKNTDGKDMISQKQQIAPRLGASWDFHGDGSLKLFANAGRYHLPVPSNLTSNLGVPRTNYTTYYTYTGVDPITGLPTGLHAISDKVSINGQFGQSVDPKTAVAEGIRPLYQDEMSLGFEKAFSPRLNFGASFNYRSLRSTNDDTCDAGIIADWAKKNNVDFDASKFPGFCTVINPGEANRLWVDLKGDGKLVAIDLSAADMGLPKVKRTYAALNLFLEHPFRDGWYGKLNYTYSRSQGNSEGQVDSIGGGDVALTTSSDLRSLMLNSDGYLPNDHTHVIKAYGFYQLTPEWMLGANLSLTSGKPRNCHGMLPANVPGDNSYGSAYWFCDGVAAPRGSMGRLPWQKQLDMNLAYSPSLIKGLKLQVDVFNVFDARTVSAVNEVREDDNGISNTYLSINERQSPRAARLTASYQHQF
ncbi:TonB-dependent receptor [Paucibacter sp. KBW04]|uniref:TonB-dependent receptor n=1 Tax=Paucibacter sp. KBW04 TaxID=2153361 RepID=UPI000F56C31D|nr:TonB-dependent receptor [Paucibacter sp. KBW04]RQO61173.1 TonB-dependent receptor [Paucibacter sp. KBW04]